MHVVFITSEFPTSGLAHGGVGSFVKFIAASLVKRGIAVSVIGFYDATDENMGVRTEEGVLIYRLMNSRWAVFRFLDHAMRLNRAIRKLNSQHKIDVVEATELGLAFIRKMPGIKYAIRMHGGHHFFSQAEKRKINLWRGLMEKRSFARADAVVGVSRYVVDHTSRYLGYDPVNIPVIFNPVNLERFYHAEAFKMVPGRIVFVGTVCEKKGIRQLVLAMPLICREVPSAHLVIAGRDWYFPSGESYRQYLNGFIAPSLKGKITFLGALTNTEVPAVIESAEVCVYPSHMEAMPLAWLEGLAMGKAVVASKTGPGPEVIQDGVTGLLCDPYSPEDIASKVVNVLKDRSLAANLSESAYVDIRARFDAGKIIDENIKFYQGVL